MIEIVWADPPTLHLTPPAEEVAVKRADLQTAVCRLALFHDWTQTSWFQALTRALSP